MLKCSTHSKQNEGLRSRLRSAERRVRSGPARVHEGRIEGVLHLSGCQQRCAAYGDIGEVQVQNEGKVYGQREITNKVVAVYEQRKKKQLAPRTALGDTWCERKRTGPI